MFSQLAPAEFCAREFASESWAQRFVSPMERMASFVMLIVLFPLIAMTAIAIVVLSGRSPLIAHRRVGQFGTAFWTLKFRTMWPTSAASAKPRFGLIERIVDDIGPEHKSSTDSRVTSAFARFCRRFSIDELPQLVNVLRGEMSLVAPRPLTGRELNEHYGVYAQEVLLAKPGIAGLWQVMGRSRLTYEQRRNMDLFLVRNRSVKLYFLILLRTIPVVLAGKDSW
jgi:lipopolysaccharide/colanic/teichoic acid biosynthesis glycosyltransferase